MIEGTRYVSGARLGEEGEQAVEKAEGGADFAAIGSLFGGRSEEAAEELIGAVYEVDSHLRHSVGLQPQREFVHRSSMRHSRPGVKVQANRFERSPHGYYQCIPAGANLPRRYGWTVSPICPIVPRMVKSPGRTFVFLPNRQTGYEATKEES